MFAVDGGGFNPDDASPRSTIHFEHVAGRQFEILQVNQKFGGLRIYVNHAADPIPQSIEATEAIHGQGDERMSNRVYRQFDSVVYPTLRTIFAIWV